MLRRLRIKLGLRLLRQELTLLRLQAAAYLDAETEHATRRGGYRQGVVTGIRKVENLPTFVPDDYRTPAEGGEEG